MHYLAVLLTVFNRKEKTVGCLSKLFAQLPIDGCKVDVFMTDDGCTDGTPEAVKEKFPSVEIVRGNGNLFWNRGMYTAWEAAAGTKDYDYYLWLNDDTMVYPNMLETLLMASKSKADKAIIIGAARATDHSRLTYGGRLCNGKVPEPDGSLQKVSYFNGNIVLVPRYVFKRLGNLDYYFTHSKGDFDYGLRAAKESIEMFQAGECLGECDLHPILDKWCNPEVPFLQRWKMLNRPNGMPPKETFHLERRHKGLGIAIFHYCTVCLRCFFPKLWSKRSSLEK